ncbi:hypothetical protein AMJ52_09915 [candidate division TA06 bacterium DG_78]|uniref:RNA polymerase sigma factor 70 region 4 type 2 domain-containing protein n=1 Tax=candidate division TA06 bacterium DG_78 TaxID=1703772 RepID=A0A0S7Y7D4_UNCT6|nr:MAG: hypothetical protein AMJ52_09915 [candidate division TA06 bacterium DG_78]
MFSEETFTYQMNNPMPVLLKEIILQKLLAELPEVQRAVLVLKFYDGMSYQEIADIMCCPLGTVKSRIHEALKKLRAMVTKKNDICMGEIGSPRLCSGCSILQPNGGNWLPSLMLGMLNFTTKS